MKKSELYTTQELLEELKVSRTTLYRMTKEGMPHIKVGREKRFNLEEVNNWLKMRQLGISNLQVGDILDNNELASTFNCGTQGGMRRAHTTNTLVLISDHTKPLYTDRWEGDLLHYCGMGKIGDQSLDEKQNKTVDQSNSNSINMYLFEVFNTGEYIFVGKVELIDEPYEDTQDDEEGHERKVWMFPLRIVGEEHIVEKSVLDSRAKDDERRAQDLDNDTLKKLAKNSKGNEKRKTVTTTYTRNSYVKQYVKRRAKGKCELCGRKPFKDNDGKPYFQVHHIEPLSKGGEDIIENAVALCVECHAKAHVLNRKEDVDKMRQEAKRDLD